ncbi:STAS-like domain-containing protein [Pseudomonas nitroreducens]|uniref:STAS-like domain-containing protein n=1 Tax=Pseudomonas nitroreducens TaxID=46680 RepID=A0A6G6J2E8_PSENT|nr:STAS-like domain-containing protein [Pseudomonas nitroreducens]QIE89489.1 STAS-like domain-containing protein [Pseudomonas nitroreducens]
MNVATIRVTKDFSEYPAGRYRADGPFAGEVFRDDLLVPLLNQYDIVEVDLDGAMGYGSSFLEETFGGLVRKHDFTAKKLHEKLKFKSDDEPSLVDEIWIYIEHANS